MKPLDPLKARLGSLSPLTMDRVGATSPTARLILVTSVPHLIRVYEAARELCVALARGERAYEAQGDLEMILEEVPK